VFTVGLELVLFSLFWFIFWFYLEVDCSFLTLFGKLCCIRFLSQLFCSLSTCTATTHLNLVSPMVVLIALLSGQVASFILFQSLGEAVLASTSLGMAVSGFDFFSDNCGFHYLPTRHGGSGFDAPWRGGAGFGDNLGDSIRFDGLLYDRAFDYSPTWHGHDGFGFEERSSSFDGTLGGHFGFDGRVPDSGINNLPIRHGHGGSGFAAPWHGLRLRCSLAW
jgi:hypothetical protein